MTDNESSYESARHCFALALRRFERATTAAAREQARLEVLEAGRVMAAIKKQSWAAEAAKQNELFDTRGGMDPAFGAAKSASIVAPAEATQSDLFK